MEVYNIDLTKTSLSSHKDIVNKCKEIINENLQVNGGTLKVANLFEKNYNWTNLIVAVSQDKIVGFALIRLCDDNKHNLMASSDYYYLSDVVVKKNYQNKGIGTLLVNEVMSCTEDRPLVASCLKDNDASLGLLSKNMVCYGTSNSGKYLRFVDNKYYNKLYNVDSANSLKPNASRR